MILIYFKFIFLFLFFFSFLWVFIDSIYQYILLPHYRIKRKRKRDHGFLYHVYFTLPYLIAQNIEDRLSNEFKEHGFILFSGKQGSGKTMAMTYYIKQLQNKYHQDHYLNQLIDDNLQENRFDSNNHN